MSTDPVAFFSNDIPKLFNDGLAQLEAKAKGGDAKAKASYDDAMAARGAMRLLLEGEGGGEIYLAVNGGKMTAQTARPSDVPVRFVFAAPADAAKVGLEQLDEAGLLGHEKAPRRLARTASGEIEKALEGHKIEFHVTLTDLPTDPDEVTIRVGVGVDTPSATPKFTATVSWDDIEDVRAGEMTPQQLLGRLKIKGDASQAMALGMSLMQRRQQKR